MLIISRNNDVNQIHSHWVSTLLSIEMFIFQTECTRVTMYCWCNSHCRCLRLNIRGVRFIFTHYSDTSRSKSMKYTCTVLTQCCTAVKSNYSFTNITYVNSKFLTSRTEREEFLIPKSRANGMCWFNDLKRYINRISVRDSCW